MNVAAYLRVSTDKQADKGYSLGEQEERVKAYCISKQWNLVKIYTDGGFTGSNLDRPALQALIADISKYDIVLVNKLDRLSRSQKDTLHLIQDIFIPNDCSFVSMQESFDTSTPIGIAMVGILSAFAQLEREQIKERLSMGRIGRSKKGLWRAGSNPPTGYDYINGHLIINEYEAEQIRLIFDLFLSGKSINYISKYMNQNYTNRYSSYKEPGTISTIIRNPLYIGKLKVKEAVYDGEHKPIIDNETFEKAQAIYQTKMSNLSEAQNHPFKATHLLSGICICGQCGKHYNIYTSKGLSYNKKYAYYACNGGRKGKCTNKNIREDILNEIVLTEIKNIKFKNIKVENKKIDHSKEIEKIEKQLEKLIALYEVEDIPLNVLSSRIKTLNNKKDKLINNNIEEPKISKKTVKNIVNNINDIFESGTIDEQRAILRTLISEIIIIDKNIDIHWNF